MSIRNPNSPVLAFRSSIASAVTDAATVLLPQDTDSITVMVTSSVFGITTLNTFVQTSPDGGSTWYDVARTSVLSNANAVTAQWIAATTQSNGLRTAVTQAASVITAGIAAIVILL